MSIYLCMECDRAYDSDYCVIETIDGREMCEICAIVYKATKEVNK